MPSIAVENDRKRSQLCGTDSYTIPYCKSENFRENFIFANSVKRHICDIKNLRLWHSFPRSVNGRVISVFCEDFIFTKLRMCEVSRKENPRENFRFTVYYKLGKMTTNMI